MTLFKSKNKLGFTLSVFFFFISTAMIWFIPLASFEGDTGRRAIAYTIGVVFWLGLILGFFFLFLINRERKKGRYRKGLPFIWFFQNPVAIVFDVLLVLSTIGLFLVLFIQGINQWISAAIIFAFVFSLEMHGMFNGKNFKYISNSSNKQEDK